MFILIIDKYSKLLEVLQTISTTSLNTINVLREYFAIFGVCKTFVTGNRLQYTSKKFKIFIEYNYIKHVLVSPYHPQSNKPKMFDN